MARIFSTEDRARHFLHDIQFPNALLPSFDDAYEYWAAIFYEIDNGAVYAPYRRLIRSALRRYRSNPVLRELIGKFEPVGISDASADLAQAVGPTCHIVLRIGSEAERAEIESWLADQGFEPEQVWSTATAVSYRLNQSDLDPVRQGLLSRPDLGWTLVPPDEPDYLLRQLFVEGPDGRRFRISDVPVQMTVGLVTAEVLEQYPEGMRWPERPIFTDQISPKGEAHRINPDNTLHQEGIGEDDQLRFTVQATAAGGGDFLSAVRYDRLGWSAGSEHISHFHQPAWPFRTSPRTERPTGSQIGVPSPLDATTNPDVLLTEKQFHRPRLTVIELAVGRSSAALELHSGYYTYYWRCRLGPREFVRQIQDREDAMATSLTLADSSENVQQLPMPEAIESILLHLEHLDPSEQITLIRFDGLDHSWVWQYAPGTRVEGADDGAHVPYAGCASTANHGANFRAASEFLAGSAEGGEQLVRNLHLLEHYLKRWERP